MEFIDSERKDEGAGGVEREREGVHDVSLFDIFLRTCQHKLLCEALGQEKGKHFVPVTAQNQLLSHRKTSSH